ncbi:MAG: hypothetical protein ACKJSK_13685, partial [Roseibacillus sp.]
MLEHHWFKRISFGTLVLLLAAGSSSGKAKHFGQLFSESGPPRSEAELYVFKGSLLAILYGDSEGRTEHENPVTTGKDGMYWFYADNGRYAIAEKAGSGYNIINPEVHIFDPEEPQTLTASSSQVALTLTHADVFHAPGALLRNLRSILP